MALTNEQKRLLTYRGFFGAYFDKLGDYETCKEAYYAVEADYEKIVGKTKYSDYASFKSQLYKFRNK